MATAGTADCKADISGVPHRFGRDKQAGQSTVEFAMILPLLLILVLLMCQVGVVATKQLWLSHVARETVRVVAHNPDVDAAGVAQTLAGASGRDIKTRTHLAEIPGGRSVITVQLEHDMKILTILGVRNSELKLKANASMAIIE